MWFIKQNKKSVTYCYLLKQINIIILILILFIPAKANLSLSASVLIKDKHSFFDQSKREIYIKKPFKRIISLYGGHTENLYALGLDKEIIGVTRNEVFPKKASKKKPFSYHDDLEKFLAASPDLVLIRPMIDQGYARLIARLEKFNIKVVSLQPGTIEEMYTYWKILGMLTDKRDTAAKMIVHFKRAVADFNKLTESIPEKKRVYFESIHKKMKTFAPNSMAIFALEAAGGINIASDAISLRGTNIAAYGKERILSKSAKIDIYLAQTGKMNRSSLHLIKNETGYSIIKAVKNDQIYFVDEIIVSRPTFRILNGIYHIGKILYKDIYKKNAEQILIKANSYIK